MLSREGHLDGLHLPNRSPKGRPLVGVICGAVQGSLGDAQSLGGDPDPTTVQGLLQDEEEEEDR